MSIKYRVLSILTIALLSYIYVPDAWLGQLTTGRAYLVVGILSGFVVFSVAIWAKHLIIRSVIYIVVLIMFLMTVNIPAKIDQAHNLWVESK